MPVRAKSSIYRRAFTPSPDEGRTLVALVRVVPTPYWLHVHRRLDAEMPEIELHCLYSQCEGDQPWQLTEQDVRPVSFGVPGEVDPDRPLQTAGSDWARAGAQIDWMRKNKVGAVVVSGYCRVSSLRIAWWCDRNNVPCFVTGDANIHADRTVGWKRFVKSRIITWMLKRCHGALAFGSAGERFFVKYGAAPDRVFYFPGEPDYARIEGVTTEEVRAAAATYGLEYGRRRLVFCGRLIPVKRVDLLIDAFEQIALERPEWDVVIIGDGPLRAELEHRVPEHLRSRVKWAGFVGDQRTLAGIYRSCDVLVLPSDHEPWALVVNEAAAAGLALVTSDVVGASENLVKPGVNGYTFPRGDLNGLVDAARQVTSPDRVDACRAASAGVLAEWRQRGDPVKGLRAALRSAGVVA